MSIEIAPTEKVKPISPGLFPVSNHVCETGIEFMGRNSAMEVYHTLDDICRVAMAVTRFSPATWETQPLIHGLNVIQGVSDESLEHYVMPVDY